MFPSRSRKSKSRRSSILKPRKPRQPLQNVNFDSSSNESSPTATKTKRRVSFAEIKHVKEFCHSTEQGTVWDNTYEEHDSSLKSSFADQNAEVELKENAPCAPDNDSVYIQSENSSYYSNNVCLVNNQSSQSIARGSEENNATDCDLDFTNPVKSTELLNASQLEYATLPNKSLTVSKDAASSGIVEYSDTAEECMESQPRQTVITSTSHISKNEESNCIAVYRDFDEEIYADNAVKYNSKSCPNNINSQLDETHIQDLSMDLTEPIPVFLLSYVKEQKKQKRNDINILDTNYTTMCHNASMEMTEAVPIFAEPVASDLGISKQIPTILQNCDSTKWDAASTCNTTGVNYANDSTILTSVIQPFKDTDICHTNNTGFDTSMEMINVPSKMYKRNVCNENIVKENDLRKDQTDKTEIFNDVPMEITRPVNILFPNVYNEENFRMDKPSSDDRTMFFHNVSMEMTKAVSTKNKQEIGNTNICRLLSEENAHGKDVNTSICFNEGTRILCKSMEFTETVPGPLCCETTFHNVHVTQFANKSTCENHKKDGTEFSNNPSMEITKSVNMLPLSINKKNLKIDESKDGKTMFFHNVSMEMTTAVSSRNRNEITQPVTCKSMFKENTYGGKDTISSTCFNERTRLLCKSMEFTEVVPNSLHDERTLNTTPTTQSSKILSKTTLLPAENSVKVPDVVTNKTVQDVSMEITTAVPSILHLVQDEKLNEFKENTYHEKDTINSICFNEKTRLLCKSMEFTEVVPNSLHDERTFNTAHTIQSSQTLSETTSLPVENSMRITDAVTNKTIQDVSMEITTAVPSILQLIQDEKLNETENSIILKNDEFQHLTTNNLTKSNRNTAKENSTISREIVEAEHIRHNELSNIIVTQSSLDNLDHSLNANFKNGSDKKRRSDASEESYSKRVRTSMEIQSFQENDIHPFANANTNYTNDIERPECFVKDVVDHTQVSDSNFVNEIEYNERFIKDTMDHTQVPDSNLRDSLSEINKDSFLRKSLPYLENSFVELQSIKPPSFVCLDNEEENSHEIQNELQSLIITDTVNNSSNQLINNLTESKCLKEKVINIENNQVENCHRNLVVDKTEDNQETNYQTGIKTLINDNQSDKSNYCTKKNISKENISMNEKTLTVQDINHCTSLIIKELKNTIEIDDDTDEDQVNEGEHTQKSTNEDIKLQSDIKEKEQYSDKKNQEIKQCSDNFEGTEEVIEEVDSEERRIGLNDEVQQQSIERKNECAMKRLETAQHISTIEDVRNESLFEQDPFLILSRKLETHGARDDCIWDIYYKNIDRKMIVFGFMSNSLLIATFLSHDLNSSEENMIREVKIISRISDDAGVLIRIVHKLILQKLNAEILTKLYKTHQDILPMLNFISQDVKLAMDFMFDLRRLDDLNLMDIDHDEISFVSRSKRMDIILRVTIKVKQFDKLTSNDISLRCLLGRIKETDIKNLIKNVKRDHKFLRRYMNDVKDYIDIIEETSNNLMTE